MKKYSNDHLEEQPTSKGVHFFNVLDAETYGIKEAILLANIRFWLDKNLANQKHIYDGRVWTYNSVIAFKKLFPYFTQSQIRRSLEKLADTGILLKANYNEKKYDN